MAVPAAARLAGPLEELYSPLGWSGGRAGDCCGGRGRLGFSADDTVGRDVDDRLAGQLAFRPLSGPPRCEASPCD